MSQSIFAVLRYEDPRGAIAFLRDVLGFEPTAVHPPEGDNVAHAELAFGGEHLMLGGEPAPDDATRMQGRLAPYLAVDDVDAHFERVRAAGGDVVYPPRDTEYGSREYAVRDPEGAVWSVGSYRPAGASPTQ
jgi:uncharacterized glyoxalase superfamily protein PhnB